MSENGAGGYFLPAQTGYHSQRSEAWESLILSPWTRFENNHHWFWPFLLTQIGTEPTHEDYLRYTWVYCARLVLTQVNLQVSVNEAYVFCRNFDAQALHECSGFMGDWCHCLCIVKWNDALRRWQQNATLSLYNSGSIQFPRIGQ